MNTETGVPARLRVSAALFLALLPPAAPAAAEQRVVAVADLHGAYQEFVSVLETMGLMDSSRQWTGGSSVLVQTGDVLDRGPKSRECLDLLMELEQQAPKQNGRVIPLLGNHEVMNIMGDLRYVSAEDYQAFATGESEKVREQAYQDYRKYLAARNKRRGLAGQDADDEAARQEWMAEHPPGFFEQRDGYGPKGLYGRWLRKRDAVAQAGDVVFLHGGLDPKLAFRNLGELNEKIRSELAAFDDLWKTLSDKGIIWRYMRLEEALKEVQQELAQMQARGQVDDPQAAWAMQKLLGLQDGIVMSFNGPLWYRGYFQEPAEKMREDLDNLLARLKARHIVVGHTVPTSRRVTSVLDNRVFMNDAGMLRSYYQGHPAALEIQEGRFTAYYADGGKQVLLEPPGGGAVPASQRSPGPGNPAP